MALKFNPFQPNKIVAPGMFTGRIPELKMIERCLYQTKNGNPHHFIIQGERGIGKSSFLLYVDMAAGGTIPFLDDQVMKFVTISIDLAGCHSQVDIIRAIGRGLRVALGRHQALREKAKAVWDWVTNWEALGIKFNKENPDIDPQDLADELVSRICRLIEDTKGTIDGLVILIDEVDQPSVDANFGQFLKLFTERLTRVGCDTVLVGMAGLPSALVKMRESHASSTRILQTLLLTPLEVHERKSVIRTGLLHALEKDGIETKITDDALELIAELSEGYPHFVQQFAFSAFDCDTDNIIDVEDVIEGAYAENGAIAQLGRKYFDEMYYGKIGSDEYRRVLDAMAEHSDGWVSRKDLIEESNVKATQVTNAVTALKGRNIIIVDEARPGFYRLPTKSFAAWINAVKSVEEKKDGEPLALFEK